MDVGMEVMFGVVFWCLPAGEATIDDIIWPTIEKKLNIVGNALDGQGVPAHYPRLHPRAHACTHMHSQHALAKSKKSMHLCVRVYVCVFVNEM